MGYSKTIPFIKIEGGNFNLFISSVSAKDSEGNTYKPLLMSDVNIKESIDLLGDNKLKISNINLALSNTKYLGKRISDDLDSYVINSKVTIYFYNTTIKQNMVDLTDDLIVFKGKVSDYNFDDLKLNFDCESAINRLWTTTVPNPNLYSDGGANIGDADNIPDKYKNKPIPIVYGMVEKSPLIIYMDGDNWKAIADSKPIFGLFQNTTNKTIFGGVGSVPAHLMMLVDGFYYPLSNVSSGGEDYSHRKILNYYSQGNVYIESNIIEFNSGWLDAIENGFIISSLWREFDTEKAYVERWLQFPANTSSSYTNTALKMHNTNNYHIDGAADWSGIKNLDESSDLDIDHEFHVSFETIGDLETKTIYGEDYKRRKWKSTSIIPPFYIDDNKDSWVGFDSKRGYAHNWDYVFLDMPLKPLDTHFECDTIVFLRAVCARHNDEGGGLFANGTNYHLYTGMFLRGNDTSKLDKTYDFDDSITANDKYYNNAQGDEGNLVEGSITTHGGDAYYDDDSESWKSHDKHDHNPFFLGNVGVWDNNDPNRYAILKYTKFDRTDKYTSMRWGKPKLDYHQVQDLYEDYSHSDIMKLHELHIQQDIKIPTEELNDATFYGSNVYGRVDGLSFYNPAVGGEQQFPFNPIMIIKDLLIKEFGYSEDLININSFNNATLNTENERLDFAINEGIKGNKLLEEMTRDLSYFPTFKNGKFDLVNVKDEYHESDYNDATTIPSKHILKYNFKRSDREKIYQKVIFKYWYDYGTENHLKLTEYGIDNVENNYYNDDYYAYYGIEPNEFTGEYEKNILELENKYIRDKATAELCAKRIFYWLNNDHLTIDLELPAYQYPNLSIGSTIKFDELLDGVKPFNIDYRVLQSPAKTLRYPIFMVSSVSKNSDKVKIKAIQLHGLHHNYNMYTESFYNFWFQSQPNNLNIIVNPETLNLEYVESVIYGCMDENYVDYNPDANVSTGCSIPTVFGCTNPAYQEYNPDANTDDGTCEIPNVLIDNLVPHGRVAVLNALNGSFSPEMFLNSGAHYPSQYYKDFLYATNNAVINDGNLLSDSYSALQLYSDVDTQNINLENPSYSLFITFANSSFKRLTEWETIFESGSILGYKDEDNNIDISGTNIKNYIRIKKVEYMNFPTEDARQYLVNTATTMGAGYTYNLSPESTILFDDSVDTLTDLGNTTSEFNSDWIRIKNMSNETDGHQQYLELKGRLLSWHHPFYAFDSDLWNYLEWSPHLLYYEGHDNWHPRIRIKVDYDIVSPHEDTTYSNSTLFTIPLSSAFAPESLGVVQNGDVNFDGNTDISDVILYLDHVLGNKPFTQQQLLVGDHNEDGQVDLSDAINIMSEILEGES